MKLHLALCVLALVLLAAPPAGAADGVADAVAGPGPLVADPSTGQGHSPSYAAVLDGGVVAAGVGLRNQGWGTIPLALPAGATVKQAYLYWVHFSPTDPTGAVAFDGTSLVGTLIGGGPDVPDLCWDTASFSWVWRADVTSLVTGSGDHTVVVPSGDVSGTEPYGNVPTTPMADGATLLVVYELPAAERREIVIVDGYAALRGGSAAVTIPRLFPAAGAATLVVAGADGQDSPGEVMTWEGVAFATDSWDGSDPNGFAPAWSSGQLWDTDKYALTVSADPAPLLGIDAPHDCVGPVAFALDAPTPPVPPPTPELSSALLAGVGLAAIALVAIARRA